MLDAVEYFITICDTGFPLPAQCDTATVIITVNQAFIAPIAVDDSTSIMKNTMGNPIDVLDLGFADFDPDGATLTIISAGTSGTDLMTNQGGAVSINDNTTPLDPTDDFIEYTPPIGFVGLDTFQYIIQDADGLIDIASVEVAVLSTIEDNCLNNFDDDGDGYTNAAEPDDNDPCNPDPQEPACQTDCDAVVPLIIKN